MNWKHSLAVLGAHGALGLAILAGGLWIVALFKSPDINFAGFSGPPRPYTAPSAPKTDKKIVAAKPRPQSVPPIALFQPKDAGAKKDLETKFGTDLSHNDIVKSFKVDPAPWGGEGLVIAPRTGGAAQVQFVANERPVWQLGGLRQAGVWHDFRSGTTGVGYQQDLVRFKSAILQGEVFGAQQRDGTGDYGLKLGVWARF